MKRVYIVSGLTAFVCGVVTVALVSACDTQCTMEARASVMVQFVDSNSDSSTPVLVAASKVWSEFTDDAGNYEILRAECVDENCTEWVLGYERPGTYEIHALVCGREYTSRAITVGMTEDGCHVETEWVKMDVDSSTCRPEALAPVDDLRFAAYTETCDVVTEIEYEVGRTVDGCHVETAYVPVFMDTHGCVQSPQPKFDPVPVLTR